MMCTKNKNKKVVKDTFTKKKKNIEAKRYLPADRILFFYMYTLPQPKAVHKKRKKKTKKEVLRRKERLHEI